MAITLTKVSGVLIITQTAGAGKYYAPTAVAQGKFAPNAAGNGYLITVGGDNYSISLTDLVVGTTSPANIGSGLVLLNSIFGT